MMKSLISLFCLGAAVVCIAADVLPEFIFHPHFDAAKLSRSGSIRYTFGKDFCRAENTGPDRFCRVMVKLDMPFRPDLKIDFDYRCIYPENVHVQYVGTNLLCGKKTLWTGFPVSREWKHGTVRTDRFVRKLPEGDRRCAYFDIYNRISDKDPAAVTAIEVRNIRFSLNPDYVPPKPPPDRSSLTGLEKNFNLNCRGDLSVKDGVLTVLANKANPRRVDVSFTLNQPVKPDSFLVFEYKNIAPRLTVFSPNGGYVTIKDRPSIDRHFSISYDWRRCAMPLGRPGDAGKTVGTAGIRASLSRRQITVPGIGIAIRNMHIEQNPRFDANESIPLSMSAIPHFDWRRAKPGETFTVTLTSNDKTQTYKNLTRNWFFPPEPLACGIWQFKVTASGKTVDQKEFRVTELSHRWTAPVPDSKRLAALPRPRLKALGEYWNPDKAKLLRNADALLKFKTQDNPPAYDAKDPRFKSWADYHRLVNGPVSTVGRNLQVLGIAYNASGKVRYADKAKEILLKVSREWDTAGGSHISAGDLRVANLLIGMCFAYDAIYDRLSSQERADIEKNMRIRADQFWDRVNPNGLGDGNHRWDNVSAMAYAALTLGGTPERFEYAVSLFAYRYLPNLGMDGESFEGLKYWRFGFGLGMRFLDLARIIGGVNLYLQPWALRTARFPLYSQPTAGYCVSFADNGNPNQCGGPHDRAMIAHLADHTGDPEARYFAGAPASGPVKLPVDIPQSMHFRRVGVAAFNTFLPDARENVQLGFHSGRFFNNHQHADQNSFVINAYGDKLAVDGGYYDSTDTPHFTFYSIAAIAHNAIMVNGMGQAQHTRDANGKITGYTELPDFGYVAGDAANEHVYNGLLTRFDRQILFIKPDYVVVYDDLAAPKPVTFEFLLHAQQEKALIPVAGKRFSVSRPQAKLEGTFLLPQDAELVSKAADYFSPPRLWDSYELNPRVVKEQILTACNPIPAKRLEFLVPMQIMKPAGTAVKWEKIENAEVTGARTADAVALFSRKPGETVKIGDMEFNGRAAAIRLENGKAVSGICAGGTVLRYQGKNVPVITQYNLTRSAETILLDGKTVKAEKVIKHLPGNRKIECISAVLPEMPSGVLLLNTAGTAGERHYILSSPEQEITGTLAAGQAGRPLAVSGNSAIFTVTSQESIGKVTLAAIPVRPVQTVMEPADFRPASPLIEAETCRHTLNMPKIIRRKGASGGMITASWGPGSTGIWDFTVPADGQYRIAFRMANGNEMQLRELAIDGTSPVICRAAPTGGFGYRTGDWRYFRLPEPVLLKAGMHTLEFTGIEGTGNLDGIAIEPVR